MGSLSHDGRGNRQKAPSPFDLLALRAMILSQLLSRGETKPQPGWAHQPKRAQTVVRSRSMEDRPGIMRNPTPSGQSKIGNPPLANGEGGAPRRAGSPPSAGAAPNLLPSTADRAMYCSFPRLRGQQAAVRPVTALRLRGSPDQPQCGLLRRTLTFRLRGSQRLGWGQTTREALAPSPALPRVLRTQGRVHWRSACAAAVRDDEDRERCA